MGSNKVCSIGLDNLTVRFDCAGRAQTDHICSRWPALTEKAGHRSVFPCLRWLTLTEQEGNRVIRSYSRVPRLSTRCVVLPRWDEHTEPTWHRLDRACSMVKRNAHKTLTKRRWQKVGHACSRAPRLSTRCVVPPRWDEHTEPTWHRLDRACSRVKRNRHNTLTKRR